MMKKSSITNYSKPTPRMLRVQRLTDEFTVRELVEVAREMRRRCGDRERPAEVRMSIVEAVAKKKGIA